MLGILDRYVAATYARVAGLAALAMAGIFYISTFLDLSDKVFRGQTRRGACSARIFWFITPQYVYYIVPLSVLLAALVTIGILTKNSELVVMKACGISLYRVAMPMLAGAIIAGGVLFMLEQTILGPSNRRAEAIRHVLRGGSPQTFDVLHPPMGRRHQRRYLSLRLLRSARAAAGRPDDLRVRRAHACPRPADVRRAGASTSAARPAAPTPGGWSTAGRAS